MSSDIVPTPLTGADQVIHQPPAGANSVVQLLGWSIRENEAIAAAATVLIRSGTTVAGPIIATIELAANGSSTEWFGPQGVQSKGGLFIDVVSGTIAGTVYHA